MLPALVLVPLLALLLALRQQATYAANAQVLLNATNVGASLNGLTNPNAAVNADRTVATQAVVARDPTIAQQALALSGVDNPASDLLNRSNVSTVTNADLLEFSVNDTNPVQAERLATNYAKAYTMYQQQVQSQAVSTALLEVTQRLNEMYLARQTGPTYRALSHEQQTLAAAQAAATNDALVVQPAQAAGKIGPKPGRDVAIGLGLGIALALGLAFLMEALDTRVGSIEEIEQRLALPLLARIPAPTADRSGTSRLGTLSHSIIGLVRSWTSEIGMRRPRVTAKRQTVDGRLADGTRSRHTVPMLPHGSIFSEGDNARLRYRQRAKAGQTGRLRTSDNINGMSNETAPLDFRVAGRSRRRARPLATLRDPNGPEAEGYRVLKSSLEFASLEHDLKSILVTCGHDYESKSTTIANLAVTLAQSGRRVLVCDLDAWSHTTTDLFGLVGRAGVTDVVLGHAALDQAIAPVSALPLFSRAWISQENTTTDDLAPNEIGFVHNLEGMLEVLPFGGTFPTNPGFLGSRAVSDLVEELKHAAADLLLIDAPPILNHGDTLPLGARVDAVVLALAPPVSRPMLVELARSLSTSPRRPLGFITVGAFPDRGGDADSTYQIEQRVSLPADANGPISVPHTAVQG